jgi:hypothetical protein
LILECLHGREPRDLLGHMPAGLVLRSKNLCQIGKAPGLLESWNR